MAEKKLKQWKYHIQALNKSFDNWGEVERQLDASGKDGWELAGVIRSPELFEVYKKQTDIFFIFKKPV